jgi:hypothetical protein
MNTHPESTDSLLTKAPALNLLAGGNSPDAKPSAVLATLDISASVIASAPLPHVRWIAACRSLIRACRNLNSLNALWSAILQEAERYTEEAIAFLETIWQQRFSYLSSRQQI